MRVIDVLNSGKPTVSFEVFPPKTEDKFDTVRDAAFEIAEIGPDFMSITYGAGGGTSRYTMDLVEQIQKTYDIPVLSHLTCVSSTRDEVREKIEEIKRRGIENILALRGDIPEDGGKQEYRHAIELIRDIHEMGDFCVGAACYPETHVESQNRLEDLKYLKEKVDAGVDFLTTQLFFDNELFYRFLYRIREIGITVPVCAGIMPITNARQVERSVKMSGAFVPQTFSEICDRFGSNPKAMRQAGILYATYQIMDLLANGVTHIHVYTMNKPAVAKAIVAGLSDILKV
ncbi:MAG: methylenetetrahydrofolate reductase [Firmicutes bacterium]|nr:methylenetetrahydrofolate reductase [NAD(P)H] [Bacillota bacterium]